MKLIEVARELMDRIIAEIVDKVNVDLLQTKGQEYAIPICGDDKDGYLVLQFKIPKGSKDGTPYDAFALQEEFAAKEAAKTEARIAREQKALQKQAEAAAKAAAKASELEARVAATPAEV